MATVAPAPRPSSRFRARQVAGRRPAIGPRRFQFLAWASLLAVALIVVTGAAVRLTGSGLGCPDWPTCTHTQLTPQLSFHPLVEFGNRLVTVALTLTVGATWVASLLRRPRRRDLCWLSATLVAGVVLQAVLGGVVVYTRLNPYLVMVHFLASMALVAAATVLAHRARRVVGPASATHLVPRPLLIASRLLLVLVAAVLAAGTATTGAGPHAGGATGQLVARRLPVALRDMAELHSTLALFTVGVALALAFALHAVDTPERVRRAGRGLVAVMAAQAAIGYTQYFTHLPAALVELHVLGATLIVIGAVAFHLALTGHPLEPDLSARYMQEHLVGTSGLAVPDASAPGRLGDLEGAGTGRAGRSGSVARPD